jgi:glycosyltransferase involved in cell wall biosynthesis
MFRENCDNKRNNKKQLLNRHDYGFFNLEYDNQEDCPEWQFVYDALKTYHNQNSTLKLDLCVDRTFHLNYEVLKELGTIPYTQPWIGFVHHTFDTQFSPYNSSRLLINQDFIKSLPHCKGLFVWSAYLREQFIEAFVHHRIHDVPVYVLTHPAETNVLPFSYERWVNNPDKHILHIGKWLRNVLYFYQLDLPSNIKMYSGKWWEPCFHRDASITKVILKGKHNTNYIPSSEFQSKLHHFLLEIENEVVCDKLISRGVQNHWSIQLFKQVSDWLNSVQPIDHVSDDTYDKLLSQNIVFIYLLDASAVNTLLECIVRCTPIIINNHPAVVELLGTKYPLYIQDSSNISEINHRVNQLLSDPKIIYRTYKYLQNINKNIFKVETFIERFIKLVSTIKH